jgi:hypothetical protein
MMRCRRKTFALAGTFQRPLPAIVQTFAWAAILFLASAAIPSGLRAGDHADRIHWKQVPEAQVKLDGKTPLTWNVCQPDKKDKKKYSGLILVLLGRRYLMLDIKARLVYAVLPSDLQPQGAGFESGDLAQPSRLIPTSEWTSRDVGPAELIRLTLGDYGRILQVSLPHPPDLRAFY